jgi:hypothetical protein
MAATKPKPGIDWAKIRFILLTSLNQVLAYAFEVILLLVLIALAVSLLFIDQWQDALVTGGRMLLASLLLLLSSRYTAGSTTTKDQ